MKLDLKLLCMALGLVLCLGQNAQVTPCDHDGTTTDKKCQGKRGGTVALKAHGASTGTVKWQKDASPNPSEITPTKGEYEKSETYEAVLKILNLKGTSKGKYMASEGGISPAQNFIVEVADCFGQATDVTCDGKPNGELWLKAIGANTATVTWKKEGTPPTTIENIDGEYEKTGAHDSTLKILNLKDAFEGKYMASGGGITPAEQNFKVQVADCFGQATEVTCDGKLNGELWLKAIGANTATVTWKKEGTPPTVIENIAGKYQKTGAHDSTLKILKLDEDTKGTYEATEGGINPTSQKFKVQVPATSANAGEGNSGVSATDDSNVGGGKANSGVSATNDSNVVSNNKGDGGNGGHSGSGNGLSYFPALLVIVTLVQLLLQLAN